MANRNDEKRDSIPSTELYDVPKTLNIETQSKPISSSSSNNSIRSSMLSSKIFNLSLSSDYDIPRKATAVHVDNVYDIPQSKLSNKGIITHQPERFENLQLPTALDTLAELQSNIIAAVSKLLSFGKTDKGSEHNFNDIKASISRVSEALRQLAVFCNFALNNAHKSEDKGLVSKFQPLVKALNDADIIINQRIQNTSLNPKNNAINRSVENDQIDQIIACVQSLTEDVRQSCAFIQGNATLLFRKDDTSSSIMDDYDYVKWSVKVLEKPQVLDPLKDKNSRYPFIESNNPNQDECLNNRDLKVILYYVSEQVRHMEQLTQAVDAFLLTVEHNQPPKFFLAYGKMVVLCGHNMVNMSDMLQTNISVENIRNKIAFLTDNLVDGLKTAKMNIKKAAQNFPSVIAVQDMVDAIVNVSHVANNLKIYLLQIVNDNVNELALIAAATE